MANAALVDTAHKDILTASTASTGGPSAAATGDGVLTQPVAPVPFGPAAGDGVLAHPVPQPPFGPPAGDGRPVHAPTTAAPAASQATIATPANDAVATHAAAPGDNVDIAAVLSSLAAAPYHSGDGGGGLAGADAAGTFAMLETSSVGEDNGPFWADIAAPDDTMNVVVGPYIPTHHALHHHGDWWG